MTEVISVNGHTGTVVLTAADVEAVPTSAEGKPSGVATLNGSGVLPEAQLPGSVVSRSPAATQTVQPTNDVVPLEILAKAGGSADLIVLGPSKALRVESTGVIVAKAGAQFGSAAGPSSQEYPGTGEPKTSEIPWTLFQHFGTNGEGEVKGTTQAGSVMAKYFSPTVNDSAEAFSAGVFLPVVHPPITQGEHNSLVGLEGDAVVQGENKALGKIIGLIGSTEVQEKGEAASAIGLYISGRGANGAESKITNWYGVYIEDPATASTGTLTNVWSIYAKRRIQTEESLLVNVKGVSGTSSQLYVAGKNGTVTVSIVAEEGQTSNQTEWRSSGGQQRIIINSSGQLGLKAAAASINYGSAAGPMIALGNITTAPKENYAAEGGGYLYAEGGALKWRGGKGTVTTIAGA